MNLIYFSIYSKKKSKKFLTFISICCIILIVAGSTGCSTSKPKLIIIERGMPAPTNYNYCFTSNGLEITFYAVRLVPRQLKDGEIEFWPDHKKLNRVQTIPGEGTSEFALHVNIINRSNIFYTVSGVRSIYSPSEWVTRKRKIYSGRQTFKSVKVIGELVKGNRYRLGVSILDAKGFPIFLSPKIEYLVSD